MLGAGGEWKSRYLCDLELWERPNSFGATEFYSRTICYERNGALRYADAWTDPCNGVRGWCDGFGFGPN